MLKFIVHSSIKKYYLHNFRHHNYYNSHDDNRNFLIKFTKFHDHSQHSLSFSLFHFAFCFCSISLLHLCNPQSRKLEMNGCFWSNCFSNRTIKLSISEEFLDLRRLSKTLCSSCYLNTQLFAVRIADKGGINGENNSSRLEFRLHTFLFFSLSLYIYIYISHRDHLSLYFTGTRESAKVPCHDHHRLFRDWERRMYVIGRVFWWR